MGKGFAYSVLPPLYIGEIAFLAGVAIFLQDGRFARVFDVPSDSPARRGDGMGAAARTLPFVGVHGFDALRDSVIIIYGGFAFLVIGLLLEDGAGSQRHSLLRQDAAEPFPQFRGILAHQVLGGLYSADCTVRTCRSWKFGRARSERIWRAPGFRPDRYQRRVSPLWVVVWFGNAGTCRRDQSRSYARRPYSARVRDAHAGTSYARW